MPEFYNPLSPEVTEKLSSAAAYGMRGPKLLAAAAQSPNIAAAALANAVSPEQGGGALRQAGSHFISAMNTPSPAAPTPAPNVDLANIPLSMSPHQQLRDLTPVQIPSASPVERAQDMAPPLSSGKNIYRIAPGVYGESDQPSNVPNRVSTIGMRTPVAQQPIATPVAQPIQQAQAPDYSDVISQLIDQAGTEGRRNSFDSKIAAKHQREAAVSGLNAILNARGQDVNAATAQNQIANNQQIAEANLLAKVREQMAADQAAAARDAESTRRWEAGYGLSRDRYALERAKAEDAAQLQQARYASGVAKEENRAALEQQQREATANAFIAQAGGELEVDPVTKQPTGNVLTRNLIGMRSVDKALTDKYNAYRAGMTLPANYLIQ